VENQPAPDALPTTATVTITNAAKNLSTCIFHKHQLAIK
jgi:hypothetical protein